MARGITQAQVNQAADAILVTGENPTVEKVRVALGTGSPNTITRMLDSWRGQLGERLRQLSALPDVPDPVGQVMIELWRLAVEQAERTVEARLATERATLEAAQAQLAQEREAWESRLQIAETSVAQAQTARDLAEHVCSTLDGQLQDSHALRADLLQQRNRLQVQCDQQSAQILMLRAELDEGQVALRAERERQEAHIRAIEDRAHHEVDRARQDAKQWQQRHEAAERVHREAVTAMQTRYDSVRAELRHLEQEVARQTGQAIALEKALSEAYAATPAKRKDSSAAPKNVAQRGQSRAAKQSRPARPGK